MHGNVNLAAQQSIIDLLGEQTLATNIGQGLVENLVAGGLDDDNLDSALLSQLREVLLRVRKNHSA